MHAAFANEAVRARRRWEAEELQRVFLPPQPDVDPEAAALELAREDAGGLEPLIDLLAQVTESMAALAACVESLERRVDRLERLGDGLAAVVDDLNETAVALTD